MTVNCTASVLLAMYLAVADEEAGGTYGASYLTRDKFDAVKADYVITESGGVPIPARSGVKLPVTVGEKGINWRRLVVKGTPGHGSMPFRTDNALVTAAEVVVQFHRRAHLPIVLASGLLNTPVSVPWWNGVPLRLTA